MKPHDLVRLVADHPGIRPVPDGEVANTLPTRNLPVGTIGTVVSVLDQGLVDAVFFVDGVCWVGFALAAGSYKPDVVRVDPITAIGSLDTPSA